MNKSPVADAVLIAGPTASGKSALALAIACEFGGAVINADSMQVYRDLRILTARPSADEEARAPHRLYGHVPAADAYSVARWLTDVGAAIAEARGAGLLPVIVGGTGLYFKALLEGLSPVPDIPDENRRFWRAEAARLGAAGLHAVLRQRDPVMAIRLRSSDPQRIARALEVLDATGRSLADWQGETGTPLLPPEGCLRIRLTVPRADLYSRCDERFTRMVERGAVGETAALLAQNLDRALPAMRAIGVTPLTAFIAGKCSLTEAVSAGQAETRRYAKRQETWVRRHIISWNTYSAQQMERTKQEIYKYIATLLDPHRR